MITQTNRGCVSIETLDESTQEQTLIGYAMYDSRSWTAWAVSPYEAAALFRANALCEVPV